jgi:amino acid adenylation domain-containing protein
MSGERALLLYPPGLDYLAAFFGCLYAGVVAVPAYPPRNQRNTPRIKAIASDAQAAITLTTSIIEPQVRSLLEPETGSDKLQWLTTDNLAQGTEDAWQEPFIQADTLAFLQYTSGSIGTPKGAMLSHGNLLHNAAMTYRFMEHSSTSKFISWLPTYHDMGLIGGILQPLYGGFPCILMPPASFLQRPYRWLKAISDYQGTTSGGPNFAYDLCIRKITPEQRETLDLSSWSVAFNGAEPVRQETLEQFAAAFADCGFRQEAFYPCYGMAEATLMVSGGTKATTPTVKTVQAAALERNQVIEAGMAIGDDVRTFISCGRTLPEQRIVIAHPETLSRCPTEQVGEIWVSGPSVGQGYWNRAEETEQTFRAYLSDTGEGTFLRTGDLGFLHNGELFITGRAKDLIIIRGRNLYPQDIELTAERSHPSLRAGCGAAFAVEVGNEEQLVVLQELEFRQKPNLNQVTGVIRQAVAEEYEVQVYAVVLIKPGSILKTSSGKIQRRACRAAFLAGELDVVSSSILEPEDVVGNESRLTREALLAVGPEEQPLVLGNYLQLAVAQALRVAPTQVNQNQPLSHLGLDSLRVFELKNRIESDLEVTISIADLFEGLSITQLVPQFLEQLTTAVPTSSLSLSRTQNATSEYPLSFVQQRLWFIHQLEAHTPAYNISLSVHLGGELNVVKLEQSLNEILKRHEILRTSFKVLDGQAIQAIAPDLTLSLPVVNLRSLPTSQQQTEARRLTAEVAQTSFDLSQPPLLCAKLLHLDRGEYQLLLTLHHLIADGWSVGVLLKELAAIYTAFSRGKSSPLPELPIQYVDFSCWQRQWFQGAILESQLNYWKQRLTGPLPILDLPTDYARPAVQTFRGARQRSFLPQTLSEAIKALSQRQGVTLFMTLLAAFKTLLYRYTGQEDILVGSPIANRNRVEIEGLIGCFVNTLVLRTDLSGNPSFRVLLERVRRVALEAYMNQDMPFEKLVEELQPERDLSRPPLFQVMFALQNIPMPDLELADLSWQLQEVDTETAKFDLTLFVEDTGSELILTLEYNTDLFKPATITRMLGHFQTLLTSLITNPEQCLSDLPLLTAAEQHQLLVEWNDTRTDYPPNQCIHQLFATQVEQTPDALAVLFQEQQLTYRELNQRSNQLAHRLQRLGVGPEVVVGLYTERSIEMLVGILGILKAGGAYVPLDPGYPKERLAFMLADVQAPVLLTQQRLVTGLPEHKAQVVCLDTDWEAIAQESQDHPLSQTTLDNLAYVIYTSGSTGQPKGTLIHHRGLANYLSWCTRAYQVEQGAGAPVHSSISFDMTITGLFSPLLVGRSVELLAAGFNVDLSQALRHGANYSLVKITPAQLELLSQQLLAQEAKGCTRALIIGGENLSAESIAFWQDAAPDTRLVNEYGPTETVVGCCVYEVPNHQHRSGWIPIGRAIANTQLYILDRHLQPVPIGVVGELYIGGAGVARGYLNRPELTAERFIPAPYSQEPGTRLYKTGDLARYLSDGTIECLGRSDHQVKVRGFRIELGEIESVLGQHPAIRETVVLAREDQPGDQRLVAYVVPHVGKKFIVSQLRDFLKAKLPEYMIPAAFVTLDALPLTINGKVDRQGLPAPKGLRPELAAAYMSPSTGAEQRIAKTWQEVLHLEQVGIYDNFFDLGGHSLLLVHIHSKLQQIFDTDVSVIDLFKYPTIHALAQYLEQHQESSSFGQIYDRAKRQKAAINRQKQLMNKGKGTHG